MQISPFNVQQYRAIDKYFSRIEGEGASLSTQSTRSRSVGNNVIFAPTSYNIGNTYNTRSSGGSKDDHTAALVLGGAAIVAGAAIAGGIFSHFSKINKRIRESNEMRKMTLAEVKKENAEALKLNEIASKQLKIEKTQRNKSLVYLASAVTVVAAGALLVAGALLPMTLLINLGAVALITGLAIAALNLGLHWNDGEDFAEIRGDIKTLIAEFRQVKSQGTVIESLAKNFSDFFNSVPLTKVAL